MKKRYQLTLTVENVETYQELASKLNLGQDAMSRAVDDFLSDINKTLSQAMSKGSFTVSDMFKLIGQQLEGRES